MILYISSSTSYKIYDRLFRDGSFYGSSPAQKFNNVLIKGLSEHTQVAALSALLYRNINAPRIEENYDGVRYICIGNKKGPSRKIHNILTLIKEGQKIAKNDHITAIICDAISVSPAIASFVLGKILHIPVCAIVTDIPEAMTHGNPGFAMKIDEFFMKKFDSYVFLTRQMNDVINEKDKPFMVMEGICSDEIPAVRKKSTSPKIILYTGALWKHDAGIEYFTEGFIKAGLKGYELHFYGQGEAVGWIKKLSEKYPEVRYMGTVTSDLIAEKQAEATLLVNPRPSDQEFTKYSFPSKTLEYMLSGTPVLMTHLPGVPEEYYNFVYTIDKETAEGVSSRLKVVLNSEDLESKGKMARGFVIANKCASKQALRVVKFVSKMEE